MTKGGGLLLFLYFLFLNFSIQSSHFLVSVFGDLGLGLGLDFKCGIFIGYGQRCLCFDLGFVSSEYFQRLGFEDISK